MLIDNFIIPEYVKLLEETFLSSDFIWHYNKSTVSSSVIPIITKTTRDTGQYVHGFYKDGIEEDQFELIKPLINALEYKTNREFFSRLLRVKVNMLTKDHEYAENYHNIPHCDIDGSETESLVYYVNDSDGDTFIFNEKDNNKGITVNYRQTPKKGTAILFDSTYLHASSPPRTYECRIVINVVFKK